MRLRAGLLSAVLLSATILSVGCSKAEPPKQEAPPPAAVSAVEEGKTLFEQKCSVCHGLDRSTARTENREEWNTIIREMQARKADWISDAEAEKILEYLSAEHGRK